LRDLGHLCRGFAQRVVAFLVLRNIEKKTRLLQIAFVFPPGFDDALESGLLSKNGLRFIAVVPELRPGGSLIQLFDTLLLAVEVKAASAEARAGVPG
jgi:hypothetical protein